MPHRQQKKENFDKVSYEWELRDVDVKKTKKPFAACLAPYNIFRRAFRMITYTWEQIRDDNDKYMRADYRFASGAK